MNTLFVYSTSWNYRNPAKPVTEMFNIPLGISYLSSLLKSKGHITKLLVLTEKTGKDIIDQHINSFNPKLICFTAVFSEYELISNAAKYIKQKYPSIYLVIGGPNASLSPNENIKDSFDAVCISEGEYAVTELAEQLEKGLKPTGIKNLWIKNKDIIEKNPTRELVADLDALPFPDRELCREWVTENAYDMQVILLGRGCPFLCTYCSDHALRKLSPGKYVRFRKPEKIIEEIKDITDNFPQTKSVYFEVETIGADMNFATELCSKLEEFHTATGKKLAYGVNLRIMPSIDYNTLFSAFKRANFDFINIGLESGSEKIRTKILRRYYSNKDIINTVKTAKKHGLKINIYALIGLPEETPADFKETINCLKECQPNEARPSIFFPYPGTDLYKLCEDKKLLPPQVNSRFERRIATLNLPEFSKRKIQHEFIWFFYNIHKGHQPLYKLLMKTLRQFIISNPILYELSKTIRTRLST